ncbi:MAG TPA: PaaI family thioesterase [Ktedonobacterales bacterium]
MAQTSPTDKPEDKLDYAPVADLIGFQLAERGDGRAVVTFHPSTRHSNPMGTLHGGVICDIADAAMGAAYSTTLQDDESFTTLEIKINFLKPVWRAALRAEGWVVKAGRTIGLAECDIYDEGGSLVARATSTNMTLRGDAARGR